LLAACLHGLEAHAANSVALLGPRLKFETAALAEE